MLMTRTVNVGYNLLNLNTNQKYASLMLIGVGITKFNNNIDKRIRILEKRDLKLINKLKNAEKYTSYNSCSNDTNFAFQPFSIYKRDVYSVKDYEWGTPEAIKGQLKSYLESRKVPFRRHPKDYSLNTKSKISSLIQIQAEARFGSF